FSTLAPARITLSGILVEELDGFWRGQHPQLLARARAQDRVPLGAGDVNQLVVVPGGEERTEDGPARGAGRLHVQGAQLVVRGGAPERDDRQVADVRVRLPLRNPEERDVVGALAERA